MAHVKLAVALLAAALTFAAGQAPAPRGIDPQKAWALIIGISNYAHAEPLQFAASDAQSFSDFLQSPRGGSIPPDHTITLIEDQATRAAVLLSLETIQEKVQNGDSIYIYIAGHGYLRLRSGYFIPSDGDMRSAAVTAVAFAQLKDMIETGLAHTRIRIVITDICHSGRIGTKPTALTEKIQNLLNEEFQNLRGGSGTFLNLLASRPSEASWEREDLGHGVFTHTLLEALNGKSVAPGDAVVDAKRLVSYLRAEVPKYTAGQQHPVANDDFDPNLTLAYLDKPGPPPRAAAVRTSLEIVNVDKTSYTRVQWTDAQKQSTAVRQLARDRSVTLIGSLTPGELELSFIDSENRPHPVKVKLSPGRNTLDLGTTRLNRNQTPGRLIGTLASLSPTIPSVEPRPIHPLAEPAAAEAGDAALTMRFDNAAQVYLDGAFYGGSEGGGRFMQLEGLAPGAHSLRLVYSQEREQRFRVKLFVGQQVFDPPSGELRFIADPGTQAAEIADPPELPAPQREIYRQFSLALREERLVEPAGNSAWDYYLKLRDATPPPLRDTLKNRLVIAMGNRAQRTILKYLRGGDVRWTAAVFEEGAVLVGRVRELFKTTPAFESQQSFFQGRALLERGQIPQAIQELQRSVVLDAEASHAFNAIGLAYWKQNLLDRAIPQLQQAMTLSPQWTYPRNTMALIYLEQRRYPEAEQMFQNSIQLDREDSTAYHGLGQLYLLLGRIEEAEVQVQKAIEYNPGNAYAHETLGRLRQRQQRYGEAEQLYRLALRLEPDEVSFQVSLADLLRQMNRSPEAEQLYKRIADSRPGDFQVVHAYTRFLRDQKKNSEAEAVFLRALKLSPGDPNLLVVYGEFLRDQGRERDAERQLKRAQQIAPDNAFVHHDLALQYLTQKKLAEAEKELALASKADPRLAAPYRLRGQIRLAQKRNREALEEFRRASELTIDPALQQELAGQAGLAESAFVQEEIDRAKRFADSGRKTEAWTTYTDALRAAPESRELRDAILQFDAASPSDPDLAMLPPGALSDVLKTAFWGAQRQADELWQKGQKEKALRSFLRAFGELDAAQRRALGSTQFNIGNESQGIHQIVHRWGLRLLDEKDYRGALDLLASAIKQGVFAVVPDYKPLTIDSLVYRPGVPDPKTILDYDIVHHPDRRAHEIFTAALSGSGKTDEARQYLLALETRRPDLAARMLTARILQNSGRAAEAASILAEALQEPKPLLESPLLADAFVRLAELQCQASDCPAARLTLQRALEFLPGNKAIETAIKRLKN